MKWYKYTEMKWAEGFVNSGRIRLNSLGYYRDIERHGLAVGDLHENTREIYSRSEFKTAAQLNDFEKSFISIDETCKMDTIQFIGSNFILKHVGVPSYAICLSDNLSYALQSRMSDENIAAGNMPYDACIEIDDHIRFVRLISEAAKEQGGLEYYGHGHCFYKEREVNWDMWNPQLEQCPAFVKSSLYSWQKEVRVLFKPISGDVSQSVDLIVPELKDFCRIRMTCPPLTSGGSDVSPEKLLLG